MALKKQSIRSNQKIYINKSKSLATKDEILALSEFWTEKEEGLFRKILKQGGSVKIQGTHFNVITEQKQHRLIDM
jgi:hypothetical protein